MLGDYVQLLNAYSDSKTNIFLAKQKYSSQLQKFKFYQAKITMSAV